MPEIPEKPHSKDVPGMYYTNKAISHPNISIGEYTYGVPIILIDKPSNRLTIGKFCSIGVNVNINILAEHNYELLSTYPFSLLKTDWPKAAGKQESWIKGDIIIGNDVWIGNNSYILGGVVIGDGAVIGANAVVAKDVAPYSIVVGNPAQQIRKRFSDEIINKLLEIRWWDWPLEKIQQHADKLVSSDIDALCKVKD